MRAGIFRNGEIVVDQMPEPKPGPGMVLVKSLACGICGSDLHARKHAHRMVELAKHLPGRKPMDLKRDVVFGEIPDAWTVTGAAFIVASGLYTAHRERVRRSQLLAVPGEPSPNA